ncbi:hypothetical protein [Lentilitoribacter sp. Alg239-R112]|uniref:hypothetical protein n=1 Tax=Lentilitoribacter sp. Alg239-R112 TaxID=2305987 RepID=UPI0013A6D2A4|nr:hypothetical protein [Lentilitoribacter sp. Alg239-R112]
MSVLIKSLYFLLFSSIFVGISVASAQNVPRLYTNEASCDAIKSAIRKNGKIVLRFKKPRGKRITYDLFYKSPSRCTTDEKAASENVPSANGKCNVSFRCIPRLDQGHESSDDPIIIAAPPPPPPSNPPDDGCNGCESEGLPM